MAESEHPAFSGPTFSGKVYGFDAGFFDGQTAKRHAVRASRRPEGLAIEGDGISLIWRYPELVLLDAARDGHRVQICHAGESGPRLTMTGANVRYLLAQAAPQIGQAARGHRLLRPLLISGGLTAAIIVFALAVPYLSRSIAPLVPERWAGGLGDAVIAMVSETRTRCTAEGGRAALDRLTERLRAGREDIPAMEVGVIDDPGINAFAAPGGRIVLLEGLIRAAKGPDEVAGVLAHEMGHSMHYHSLARLIEALGAGIFLESIGGDFGSLANLALTLSYSREDEREADGTAVELLAGSGISTAGLADFFDRLAGDSDDGGLSVYAALASTHPLSAERAQFVRQGTETGAATTPALSDEEWDALKAICDF